MRGAAAVLAAAMALAAATAGAEESAKPPAYVVIVHESNTATALDRKFIADAFLKKATRWGNDAAILPVDQKASSSARHAFSRGVLKRTVAAVRNYWRQIVFSGRGVPPPELADDDAVLRYVRKHRGAIGYVSGAVELTGVKVVRVK